MTATVVRDFRAGDEASWLRCRVLGFLDTSYYDDVWPARPEPVAGLALVAAYDDGVAGICDASMSADLATIDTIVVHPDHRRHGLATLLLDELIPRLRARRATTLEAWTRDDQGTHAWYEAAGFRSVYRYLHVHADGEDEMAAAGSYADAMLPRTGFFHVDSQDPDEELALRRSFRRVHACHRFVRQL